MRFELKKYQANLQTFLKKWEDLNNTKDYFKYLDLSPIELKEDLNTTKVYIENLDLSLNKLEYERKKTIVLQVIFELERAMFEEIIDKSKRQLKKINDNEDKNTFFLEHISPMTAKWFQNKAELLELEQNNNDINREQSEREISKNTLIKLEKNLVNLEIIIKKLSFFNSRLKQLKELKQEFLRKEDLETELQSLESLIKLEKQKAEIALEIQRLVENKQQLATEIANNITQIQVILNNNNSSTGQLITKISEINAKIQILNKNIDIDEKNNLISHLDKEIKNIEKDIAEKTSNVNNHEKNIIILENWRDSIWRSVIAVLTFGICGSKKNVENKLTQEYTNRTNIIKEINKLKKTNLEKLNQKNNLSDEISKYKEETSKLKENWLVLKTQLNQEISTKNIEELKKTNCQKQFLIENATIKIKQQKEKLRNISIENTQSLSDLEILQKQKTDKLNSLNTISLVAVDEEIKAIESDLDNFKQAVAAEIQKTEIKPFSEIKPFLEKSDSRDSGINMSTESLKMVA